VSGVLFFKEPVHRPFDALEEILRKEQTNFVGIGNCGRAALLFLSSSPLRRWNFFMSNRADPKFVFGEKCRIERNLIPISKSPSCFQTHCLRAAAAIKPFELRFGRYVETIWQPHFDLLSKEMIGRPVPESLSFIQFAEEKRPWRQYIGI